MLTCCRTNGEARDLLVPDREAVGAELGDGGVHVAGVEEDQSVEDEAEGADLVLSEPAQPDEMIWPSHDSSR